MKSYKNALISTKSYGEIQALDYRPTMRSSAVFPLLHKPNRLLSIYTFMGYWLSKKNIAVVTALLTVRDKFGEKLMVRSIEITDSRAFEILSCDVLKNPSREFSGSVEIEIFSAVDMVFPYPAITFALKGVNGLTFVHTCGRIYNDFDDVKANNEQLVSETGFDLYIGKDWTPFFSFVNGPVSIENEIIELEYINEANERVIRSIEIDRIPPYGLGWINLDPGKEAELSCGLNRLCVKIKHNFKGFFPRFIAGNVMREFEDVSLTHSFYDTSNDCTSAALWKNPNVDDYEDSAIVIPFDAEFPTIELAVYPNFSRSPVKLSFELFASSGQLICSQISNVKIGTGADRLAYVDIIEMFADYKASVPKGMVRIVCLGDGTVPARMKFGLNFCSPSGNTNLPSNVCFNAEPPNEKLLRKPGTFRWCAIFDVNSQKIYLHNSSFLKCAFRDAEIDICVYRSCDEKRLNFNAALPYNGTIEILRDRADAIGEFLFGSIGWITFRCSSPFVSGYYITDFGKGVVGADHLY
jgi:hypothetical protein